MRLNKSNWYKRLSSSISFHILFSVFLIFIMGNFIGPASAATINVTDGLQNSDIQAIIDSSNVGDTLNFLGNSYTNISLIITKKLNIITLKNTILSGNDSTGINGSSMGLNDSFVFYFTNTSSGSIISGFNIIANSDYGILSENSKNLTISSNNISGGQKGSIKLNNVSNSSINKNNLSNSQGNGLDIENSKNISASGNQIINNKYSGIKVYNSSDIKITKNKVLNNNLSGISIYSSKNVSIKNSTIEKNVHGVYVSNTYNTNVSGNEINRNRLNGIHLAGKTENTYISYNNLTENLNGIYIDAYSINDTIIANNIVRSYTSTSTDYDILETGNGIEFGGNYQESNKHINIRYNAITDNSNFEVKSTPNYDNLNIGPNWYGSNDLTHVHVCPMINTEILTAKLVQTGNGVELRFYDGNKQVSSMPEVAVQFLQNGKYLKTAYTQNGVAILKGISSAALISAIIGKDTLSLLLTPDSYSNDGGSSNGDSGSSNNGGSGNGPGSGNGNGTANGTSSGVGVGESKESTDLAPNSQTGSSNGDSDNGKSALEVSINNAINSVKNNPYLSNLGIFIILALIALGYYKRDKF